jgi:hypothetical protein
MPDHSTTTKAILWASAIWAAHLMAMLLATIVTIVVVESCIMVLEKTDVDIASSAILAINLSDYCRNYWYTLIVLAALDAIFLVMLGLAPAKLNWLRWFWSTLWFLGALLFLAFCTSAIVLPTVEAIQQLQRP